MIKNIAFTVYAVTDMAKSRAFYEGVLGLKTGKEFNGDTAGGMWVEYEVGGATFAIGCAPEQYKPSADGAVVTFEVDDIDATIADLKAKKVTFMLEKQEFPSCHMAIILDPDKSRIIIHKKK